MHADPFYRGSIDPTPRFHPGDLGHESVDPSSLVPGIEQGIDCGDAAHNRQDNVPMLNADPDLVRKPWRGK